MLKLLKKLAPPIAIVTILLWTSVSWAMSSDFLKLEIPIVDNQTFPDGEPVRVTPLFTDQERNAEYAYAFRNRGKAKKIGLPLFKIQFSDVSYLTLAKFYISAQKSGMRKGNYDVTKDKWWLITSLYYEVSPAAVKEGDIEYKINGEDHYYRKITGTTSRLNNQQAIKSLEIPAGHLPENIPKTFYILGSYANPADKIPPGKQKHLTRLQFNCYISF